MAVGGDGGSDDGSEQRFQDGRSGRKKDACDDLQRDSYKNCENGRSDVCGEFSVWIGFESDVNEGFDEELDEIVGEDGRGEAYAGDAGDEGLGGRYFEHVPILLAHAFQKKQFGHLRKGGFGGLIRETKRLKR